MIFLTPQPIVNWRNEWLRANHPKRGYSVAVNFAENERAADMIVGDIRKAGAQAVAVQGDVSLEHDVRRLFETVDQELGPLR